MKNINLSRSAFTLVEIMVVVAIIALLASIAVPNFLRARKRSQATTVLEDLRVIDGAQDQYAIEFNKMTGDTVTWSAIQLYLKDGSVPWFSNGMDRFGYLYNQGNAFSVDHVPKLNPTTYSLLSDCVPVNFWSPYYP